MTNTTEKGQRAMMRNWDLKMIAAFRVNLTKMEEGFPLAKNNFINIRIELDMLEQKIREYNAANDQMRLQLESEK